MTLSDFSRSFKSSVDRSNKQKSSIARSKKFTSYNLLFIFATCIQVLTVGIFNWAIDPYDLFDTPNYWGVNHEKPKKDNNDRAFKAVDITRIKPQTIIMGSSRTKQGIDPKHPVFKNDPLVYNLAINGPNFYEVRRYIEHAIANQPEMKEIVLGVDFFMFNNTLDNQPSFDENRLGKKHIIFSDAINALFSLDTITTSIDTIKASQKSSNKNDDYGENGFMPNRNYNNGETIWRFRQSIKLYFQLHSDYQFSEKYWSDYQQIVQLCQENNITLKVFISPSHATQWESIYATNKWETFEQWKRQLVKLTPVWDFSGYNTITTEAIAKQMNNYVDNSHYTPAIGNLILDRLYNYQIQHLPADFGVLLTPKNIDTHLATIRRDRANWVKNQPDEVKLVQDIYRKFLQPITK